MSTLQSASQELIKFKLAYTKGDLKTAETLLGQLKLKLISLPSLVPSSQLTPSAQQELTLARDVYEHAALFSLCIQDEASMERSFTQLKAFYADTKTLLPKSSQEQSLLGLDLLRLLVQNRIAEFHTDLELIPPEEQGHPSIQYAVQLEQWLMEGAYNKVLEASKHLPSESHALLVKQVASTVRDEIASCSEKAYAKLRLPDAQKMMMFDSEVALRDYASEHGWHIADGCILFTHPDAVSTVPGKEDPSIKLINNTLVYAKELERIV